MQWVSEEKIHMIILVSFVDVWLLGLDGLVIVAKWLLVMAENILIGNPTFFY